MFDEKKIEKTIGYVFKNKALLKKAFTHPSYDNTDNYQRLEFLGDSFLNYAASKELFYKNKIKEGGLTELRKGIVSKKPLAAAMEKLSLKQFAILGGGETADNLSVKAVSDLFEALTGAILVDGGEDAAKKFVFFAMQEEFDNPKPLKSDFNELKEYCEREKISFEFKDEQKGAAHDPEISVTLFVNGKKISEGKAGNKSEAKEAAAGTALRKLIKK